ncbi:hypothetical protein GGQ99_005211 [Aminobacter niigataensis]|uniref:Uncharacterized protein n=1 Tax=Aminobacter niigataensis TaxID=83265 RepID=A0ABR6L9D9_9HYPH|nr:hypothetical protein [Aminobacter niigataensis]MBB4653420.1 hypothetical protein [Aminobacter niigataensis]
MTELLAASAFLRLNVAASAEMRMGWQPSHPIPEAGIHELVWSFSAAPLAVGFWVATVRFIADNAVGLVKTSSPEITAQAFQRVEQMVGDVESTSVIGNLERLKYGLVEVLPMGDHRIAP